MEHIKRLTDVQIAEMNNTSTRNLQQTYKNAKSNKYITLSEEQIKIKRQQYDIMRLGSTCLKYDINEETLLKLISSQIENNL